MRFILYLLASLESFLSESWLAACGMGWIGWDGWDGMDGMGVSLPAAALSSICLLPCNSLRYRFDSTERWREEWRVT